MTSRSTSLVPFLALLTSACQLVYGNGEAASEDRTSGGFDAVSNLGALQLDVVVDGSTEVTAECDRNLLEYIDTYVEDDVLHVAIQDGFSLQPRELCRVVAHTPSLAQLSAEGSGPVHVEGVATPLATVELNGSASIEVEVPIEVETMVIDGYGSGRVTLRSVTATSATIRREGSGGAEIRGGAVDALVIDNDGSGDIATEDLDARSATVDLYGSGSVRVSASERSDVRIEGSGSVWVHGAPDSRDESIQGSGEIFYE